MSIYFKWSVLILTLVNADKWVPCVHTDSLGSQCLPELENRCLRYYFKRFFKFNFVGMIYLSSYMECTTYMPGPTEAREGVGPSGIVVLDQCEF